MNITLIGASGFIGSCLIDKLRLNDHQLLNIDKQTSYRHNDITALADIRDVDAVKSRLTPADWVVLLAAEHRDDVRPASLYFDVNVEGTRKVLQAMEEKGIHKVVFTSTVAVYGLNKPNPGESHPADPFNDYGKSKWQAEEVLREWYHKDPEKRTLIILRPTVVFGPGNRGNVYNLLKQISSGKFLMIGNGENKKSMAYVENIAEFIKYCIEHNIRGYNVYNYVDKPDLSTKELIASAELALGRKVPPVKVPYWLGYLGGLGFDLVSRVTGKKFPVSSIRVKKFVATTQFTSESIKNTGYKPVFSLDEGIRITVESIIRE